MLRFSTALLLGAFLSTACGDESGAIDAGDQADAPPPGERFLPIAEGASWTYLVTPMLGAPETKSNTVGALEDVGGMKAGTMAYKITTEKLDGVTISWQEDTGSSIVRHREQSYDLAMALQSDQFYVPNKLRIDEGAAHTMTGASWSVTYQEVETDPVSGMQTTITKNETWTVEQASVSVTVPAGTFDCIQLRRSGDITQAAKTFWFARGVGKVKELGDQTEELTEYSLP